MNKKNFSIKRSLVVAAALLFVIILAAFVLEKKLYAPGEISQQYNKGNCLMDTCLLVEDADYPIATLDEQGIQYLQDALADERKARSTYEAVIEKFGPVRPFINIIRAEEQHISALKALYDKYGVVIPEDKSLAPTLPATLQEVCQMGVEAEIANDELYQKMLPQVEQEDIRGVFTTLAQASREMHLPAFQRCAQ